MDDNHTSCNILRYWKNDKITLKNVCVYEKRALTWFSEISCFWVILSLKMYVALFKNLYLLYISKYPEQWSKSLKVGLLKNLHFFHAKLTCCVTTEVPKCCSIRKLYFSHIKLTSRAMIKIYECCTIGILHFAYNSFLQRQQKPLNVALLKNYTLEYLKKIYFPYTKLTSSSITRTLFFYQIAIRGNYRSQSTVYVPNTAHVIVLSHEKIVSGDNSLQKKLSSFSWVP